MRRLALVFVGLGLTLAGCGGDQKWSTDPSWQGEEKSRRPGAFETEANALTPAATDGSNSGAQTLFGVRHDLSMKPGTPRTAACGCLAVEVGMPGKQAFAWDGQVPSIGPDAVVVALSARGVDCPAEPDESKRRASISAVDRDGDDVLIEIEELPEGRPLALGAIIPKPGPNGALYLQPKSPKVRLASQADGKRCKVKAPSLAAQPPADLSGAP